MMAKRPSIQKNTFPPPKRVIAWIGYLVNNLRTTVAHSNEHIDLKSERLCMPKDIKLQ